MKNSQRIGGIAALINAAVFVVGIALALTVLSPYMVKDLDPGATVAFLADNQMIMYIWNLIIYLVFGVFLVVLTLSLYERLRAGSPAIAQTAAGFGLIWATLMLASGLVFNIGSGTVIELYGTDQVHAGTVWLAISSVLDGLGGGNEIVGALWILLVSWAALRAGGLSKALDYVGVVISVAGLLTLVPGLEILGFIFGLGSIVWFVWLGITMFLGRSSATT